MATKKAIAEFVRRKLSTDERWAKRALLAIYDFQTAEEKNIGITCRYNNVGFSGAHSEIMSSLAVQLTNKGWLSPKQMNIVYRIIPKYTRQIIMISNPEKLEALVS